jgi:MFS family permease
VALAPILAIAFVRAERRLEARGGLPLVPFSVVGMPSMRRGVSVGLPFFTGFGGFMFVYTLSIQGGAGFSPLRTGLLLTPMAVGFLASSLAAARLLRRFGRRVITVGALVQATGLCGLALALEASWPHPDILTIAPALLVTGLGQGCIMSPLMGVVLSDVPPHAAGVGSGVLATTQQTSLALGVATLGTLYLTEAPTGRLGPLHSLMVVLGVLIVVALSVSRMSRRLPDPPQHLAVVPGVEGG